MQSNKSKSYKPILGYIKSNLETNGFVALILTLVLTAVSFICAHNSWYGSGQEDISLLEGASLNLGRLLFVVGFAFAAYQFRPFLIKTERDVVLALPIKQSHLIISGLITGLISIFIAGALSGLVFYPAMNLSMISSGKVYLDCISATFCNIIFPLCVYFLFSALIILKTRDFISSIIWSLCLAICCFAMTSWLKTNGGFDAIGVYRTELFQSAQPFYFDAGLYLPTIGIGAILRSVFPIGTSFLSAEAFSAIINLALCAGMFLYIYKATPKTYLGEMDRPYKISSLYYALPLAALMCVGCAYGMSESSIGAGFVITAVIGGMIVVVTVFSKNLRQIVTRAVCCALIVLIPALSVLLSPALSRRTTYDVPSAGAVKAVYFNAIEPKSAAQWGAASQMRAADLAENCAKTRYRFESKESIKAIVELHKSIVKKIKENSLVGNELGIKTGSFAVASEDKLNFELDDYLNDYGEQLNIDMGYSLDITPGNNLPLNGPLSEAESSNFYTATFYYEMADGKVFRRAYTPLPVDWIEEPMRNILRTEEYSDKQIKSLLKLSGTSVDNYQSDLTVYSGMAKDFYSGRTITVQNKNQLLKLCRAIISDEAKLSDNEILGSKITYTVSFDMSKLINSHSQYLYIRDNYKKSLKIIDNLLSGGEE
jgi:hypothetical protein